MSQNSSWVRSIVSGGEQSIDHHYYFFFTAESWVTKGPKTASRLEPRGRGHYGIQRHPNSRLHVVLKEGKTVEEKKAAERAKKLRRIVSSAIVREDKPLRNPGPMWGW